jgi:hypothetical protein
MSAHPETFEMVIMGKLRQAGIPVRGFLIFDGVEHGRIAWYDVWNGRQFFWREETNGSTNEKGTSVPLRCRGLFAKMIDMEIKHKMKVKVKHRWSKNYTVYIVQGNQGFFLDYEGPKDECLWYARMFRKALKNHDTEVRRKGTTT